MAANSFTVTDVDPKLHQLYHELKGINEEIAQFAGSSEDLREIRERLNLIDSARVGGAFMVARTIPHGQAVLHTLLVSCYTQLQLIRSEAEVSPLLQPTQHEIEGVIKGLEHCKADPSQLPRYQGMLDAIDNKRVNGIFLPRNADPSTSAFPLPGQGTLIDQLSDAYAKVHSIQVHSDRLECDRELDPRLHHTARCLHSLLTECECLAGDEAEVRRLKGRVNAIEESAIDGIFGRIAIIDVNDKVCASGDTPKGQGTIRDLIERCHKTLDEKQLRCYAADEAVDPHLQHISHELDRILRDIKVFGKGIDEAAVRRLQGRLLSVDNKRVDGVFVPQTGAKGALRGQAALSDKFNEASRGLTALKMNTPSAGV